MRGFLLSFLVLSFFIFSDINSQSTTPIRADRFATFNVPNDTTLDSLGQVQQPYFKGLGVRRVIVADANGDGQQEIIATDYTNGGRVHVMSVTQDSSLEIIWSSPVASSSSGSTPRFVRVGDCDGDGKFEIIFEQRNFDNGDGSFGRIVIYEWNPNKNSWGDAPSFSITPSKIAAAGGREGLRLHREVLMVYDFDKDGKSEIIPYGDDPRQDVLILGITGDFFEGFNFAGIQIEGGKPGVQPNGEDWGAGGSFWNATPADINGDGKEEIIVHTWNNYGFWSIGINGPNSYDYPSASSNADARAKGVYNEYGKFDEVSYFGAQAVDVDGDGKHEIVGTMYQNKHNVAMLSFPSTVGSTNFWTEESKTENFAIIKESSEIAALAGKTAVELWPIVKGDLNKDGKDELYTGGGNGLNLIALQYKGEGNLLDPNSYDMNLVYNGEGGEVFARWEIYRGKTVFLIDSSYVGDSLVVDTTGVIFDPAVSDTFKLETPFTSYIFADNVDLDKNNKQEIVLAQQSVYDSVDIDIYDWIWNDPNNQNLGGRWEKNLLDSYKIFNDYRQTIIVLEYNDEPVGFRERTYSIITPDDYKLEQNYPNPFNPVTTINFSLPVDKKISLKIYDMVGQEIKSLLSNEDFKKGSHEVVWDGTNNIGTKVASGNYIAKLEFGNFAKSIKMTLLK